MHTHTKFNSIMKTAYTFTVTHLPLYVFKKMYIMQIISSVAGTADIKILPEVYKNSHSYVDASWIITM